MAGFSCPPRSAALQAYDRDLQPLDAGTSMLALVRCRECNSRLLQLERTWLLADGRHVADRRCPECGTRDSVAVGAFATKLWLARERRFRRELIEAADELARGARLPVIPFVKTPKW